MVTKTGPRLRLLAILLGLLTSIQALAHLPSDSPIQGIGDSLRARWGDSPRDADGQFLWLTNPGPESAWLDNESAKAHQPADHDDIMWIRFTIPEGEWHQPILYFPQVLISFEIYADTTLIYQHAEFAPDDNLKFCSMTSYIVPLPDAPSGTVISCRIYSPYRKFIGISTQHRQILLGQQDDVVHHLFYDNVDSLILGSLFFFAGIISLAIFLLRFHYRIWYLLSFAMLACNIGIFYILSDAITSLLGISPRLTYYLGLFSFVAFPVGLYTFLEQITGEHKVLRRLWQFHLLYLAVVIPLDVTNIVLLPESGAYYSMAFAASTVIGMIIVGRAMMRGSRQARIFGIGFSVFALTGLHDLLAGLNVIPLWHWLSHWGMLVLILHLTYILEQTYSSNLRKLRVTAHELKRKTDMLEEYSANLEQRVADRTRDLATKNEQLVETMRDLKDAQAQMVMQDKMASLGNLVAGVAHELNTPMGAVVSAADVETRCIKILDKALDESTDIDELRASTRFQRARTSLLSSSELINSGSQRIAAILASLKSFVRLDEGAFQEVDLHEGLDSTLTLLHHETKNHVEVIKDYGDLPRLGCNAGQINQVFMNVLANAVQAIDDQGTITIATACSDDEVTIRIADTGRGIAAPDRERIFDPGYTTRGVGVGTGLGLSICYRIMQDHGGRIEVESVPGQGTVIELGLPVNRG